MPNCGLCEAVLAFRSPWGCEKVAEELQQVRATPEVGQVNLDQVSNV